MSSFHGNDENEFNVFFVVFFGHWFAYHRELLTLWNSSRMGRKKQSAQRGQVEDLWSGAKFRDAVKGNHNKVSSILINSLEWFWYIHVILS